MCWDISLKTDIELVKSSYPKIRDERKKKEYNYDHFENVQAITFPDYPVIFKDKLQADITLKEMQWGILPTFIEDPSLRLERRRNMVNIRSERILGDKKSMWHRLQHQRCLIPVSGTYEHRKIQGWKKKVPYYISQKDREIFYIPGLYQWHQSIDSKGNIQQIGSFGMLTRTANPLMASIHNHGPNKHRMPLMLPEDLEKAWISQELEPELMEAIFHYQIPQKDLTAYPVYTLRGYPDRPDSKHRYEPFLWPGLPPLGEDYPNAQTSLF